jgi:hypothetical protein
MWQQLVVASQCNSQSTVVSVVAASPRVCHRKRGKKLRKFFVNRQSTILKEESSNKFDVFSFVLCTRHTPSPLHSPLLSARNAPLFRRKVEHLVSFYSEISRERSPLLSPLSLAGFFGTFVAKSDPEAGPNDSVPRGNGLCYKRLFDT